MNLSEYIREYCLKHGHKRFTATDLAKVSGYNRTTLWRWYEADQSKIEKLIDKHIHELDTDIKDWLSGKGHCQCLTCQSELTK